MIYSQYKREYVPYNIYWFQNDFVKYNENRKKREVKNRIMKFYYFNLTSFMTPTATVCPMSRAANRPNDG